MRRVSHGLREAARFDWDEVVGFRWFLVSVIHTARSVQCSSSGCGFITVKWISTPCFSCSTNDTRWLGVSNRWYGTYTKSYS